MIEFHLDGRSGVSPYLQLVQQVRRALRLGLLSEGDQLPTVKDVVGHLAINPNTVLKAYRELEHEGLVAARPGRGHLRDPDPDRQHPRRARAAAAEPRAVAGQGPARGARRREHRGAVPCHVSLRGDARRPHEHRPARPAGLGKKYGRKWALSDCTLEVPAGRVVGLVGPNGAGKSTFLNLAVGLLTPSAGDIEVLGARPTGPHAQRDKVGYVGQDTPTYAGLSVRRPPAPRRPPQPRLGRRAGRRSHRAARPRPGRSAPAGSPAASAPSSRSRWASPSGPSCCCSTSRWPASTRSPVGSSSRT